MQNTAAERNQGHAGCGEVPVCEMWGKGVGCQPSIYAQKHTLNEFGHTHRIRASA